MLFLNFFIDYVYIYLNKDCNKYIQQHFMKKYTNFFHNHLYKLLYNSK